MFTMKIETRTMIQLLEAAIADYRLVTYEELRASIGMDVRHGSGYGYLRTAINHILAEKQVVFDVVRAKGVQRARPTQIVDEGGKSVRRIGRAASRAANKMTSMSPEEFASLEHHEQAKHNTRVSVCGVITAFSAPTVEKRLESQALASVIPPMRIAELFAGTSTEETKKK